MAPKQPKFQIVRRNGTLRPARRAPILPLPPALRFPIVIQFERGKSLPAGSSLQKLRRCAEWLVVHRLERLVIIGHANLRGWDKAARALANARTDAVHDLLAWLGARREQLLRVSAPQLHRIRLGSTRSERVRRRVVEIWRMPQPARSISIPVSAAMRRARAISDRRWRSTTSLEAMIRGGHSASAYVIFPP